MKTRQEEEVFSFILAPLIDIMLFILIFFMVSYQKQQDKSSFQPIDLPLSETSALKEGKEELFVLEINEKEEFFLNGKLFLKPALLDFLKNQKAGKPIIIRAQKTLSYQVVITTIDSLKKVGVAKVYLATDSE